MNAPPLLRNNGSREALPSPAVSIIIPVLNEAETINPFVDRLFEQTTATSFEVIVVDGNPSGNTLRVIDRPDVGRLLARRGRAAQMNSGAHRASGRILLFLHADTALPAGALNEITSLMDSNQYPAGAFDLGIDSPGFMFRIIERVASLRSRMTRIPFGDQAIFVDRNYFLALGGFKEIPLMEDVELMKRIRVKGDSVFILPLRVSTSPRRWEKEGVFFRTIRNWCVQILYICGVSPEKLAKLYLHE